MTLRLLDRLCLHFFLLLNVDILHLFELDSHFLEIVPFFWLRMTVLSFLMNLYLTLNALCFSHYTESSMPFPCELFESRLIEKFSRRCVGSAGICFAYEWLVILLRKQFHFNFLLDLSFLDVLFLFVTIFFRVLQHLLLLSSKHCLDLLSFVCPFLFIIIVNFNSILQQFLSPLGTPFLHFSQTLFSIVCLCHKT